MQVTKQVTESMSHFFFLDVSFFPEWSVIHDITMTQWYNVQKHQIAIYYILPFCIIYLLLY